MYDKSFVDIFHVKILSYTFASKLFSFKPFEVAHMLQNRNRWHKEHFVMHIAQITHNLELPSLCDAIVTY